MPELRKAVAVRAQVLESDCWRPGLGCAQKGQMQALPRASAGSWASASCDTGVCMHQQLSGGRPALMAHWLGWPHKGQRLVSMAGWMGMASV